ncbi:hypothetical protein AAVH_43344, partial [Aphelenchoides avenae]
PRYSMRVSVSPGVPLPVRKCTSLAVIIIRKSEKKPSPAKSAARRSKKYALRMLAQVRFAKHHEVRRITPLFTKPLGKVRMPDYDFLSRNGNVTVEGEAIAFTALETLNTKMEDLQRQQAEFLAVYREKRKAILTEILELTG